VRKSTRRIEPAFAAAPDDFNADASARGRRIDSLAVLCALLAMGAIAANALFLQKGPHPAPIFSTRPPAPKTAAAPAFPLKPVVIAPAPQAEPTTGAVVLPRPRPAAEPEPAKLDPAPAARPRAEVVAEIQKELSRRGFYDGMTDGVYGSKTDAAIRDFEHAASIKAGGEPDEAMLRTIKASSMKAQPVPPAPVPAPRGNDAIGDLISPPSKRVVAVQRVLADYGYGQIKPTGVFDKPTEDAIEQFERARKLPVTRQISPRLMRELASLTGRPLE
jgi:peptidoglycan hydrolase-like protein with peptidoglycan-binding domain